MVRDSPARHIIKLGGVIAGEEDIVVGKVEPAGPRMGEPDHGGERARLGRRLPRGFGDVGPEQPCAERGGITVEDNR
jgi:hypothetical protein